MNNILTTELYWLELTVMMTALFWLPYILNRVIETGVWSSLGVPKIHPEAPWAQRLMRAHVNAVENLVVFAPLILIVQITGVNSATTAIASTAYFFARLAHMITYTLAVPVVRTLAFLGGFLCQMTLAFTLLGIV